MKFRSFYCGIGPVWNKLSSLVVLWFCSSCRTNEWNRSEFVRAHSTTTRDSNLQLLGPALSRNDSVIVSARWVNVETLGPRAVAYSFRIVRAGIGVFCLLGLTKVICSWPIFRTQPPLPVLQPPKENTEIATLHDTMWHYFVRFRLKICYCSWPPKFKRLCFVKTLLTCSWLNSWGFLGSPLFSQRSQCF